MITENCIKKIIRTEKNNQFNLKLDLKFLPQLRV